MLLLSLSLSSALLCCQNMEWSKYLDTKLLFYLILIYFSWVAQRSCDNLDAQLLARASLFCGTVCFKLAFCLVVTFVLIDYKRKNVKCTVANIDHSTIKIPERIIFIWFNCLFFRKAYIPIFLGGDRLSVTVFQIKYFVAKLWKFRTQLWKQGFFEVALVSAHQSHRNKPLTASGSTENSGITHGQWCVCVLWWPLTLNSSVCLSISRPPQPPWRRVFWQKSLTRWWTTTTQKASNPSACQTTSPQEHSAPDNGLLT